MVAIRVKKDESGRYFAGFICFLGYILFIVAVLTTLWPTGPSSNSWQIRPLVIASLALYMGGVAIIFLVALRRRPWRSAVGGIILLLAALILIPLAIDAAAPPRAPTLDFAMTVPLSDEGAGGSSAEAAQGEDRPPRTATLFWTVPESSPPFRSGLLLMVLASLVITIYGVIYPIIAAGKDEEAKGFVQRLIIPAIGFVLFGFGASSQVAAEERRENVLLIQKGLPPAVNLSREERSAYILREEQVSTVSMAELHQAILQLARIINERGPTTLNLSQEDRDQVLARISNVENSIREGDLVVDGRMSSEMRLTRNLLRQTFAASESSLNGLTSRIEDLRANSHAILANLDAGQKATLCAILGSGEINADVARNDAAARLQQAHDRERENILTSTWLEIIGRHPSALNEERERLSAALGGPERAAAIRRQGEALLPPRG